MASIKSKESEKACYEDLKLLVDGDHLPNKKTMDFCASLCEWYETKGYFTEKQFEAAEQIIDRGN